MLLDCFDVGLVGYIAIAGKIFESPREVFADQQIEIDDSSWKSRRKAEYAGTDRNFDLQ